MIRRMGIGGQAPGRRRSGPRRTREFSDLEVFDAAGFRPAHFGWTLDGRVGTITLDRPERKNPLTFESYAELRDLFRDLVHAPDVKTVVVTGAGGNFCSGG